MVSPTAWPAAHPFPMPRALAHVPGSEGLRSGSGIGHRGLTEQELAEPQALSYSEVHVAVACGADGPPAGRVTPHVPPTVRPQAAPAVHTLPACPPPPCSVGALATPASPCAAVGRGQQAGGGSSRGLCLSLSAWLGSGVRGNRSWFGKNSLQMAPVVPRHLTGFLLTRVCRGVPVHRGKAVVPCSGK